MDHYIACTWDVREFLWSLGGTTF